MLNSKTVFFVAVLKIMKSMALKLEVCIWGHDSLSRIAHGIDPYTSAKFCAFNTNLKIVAQFFCTTRAGRLQEWLQGDLQPYSVYIIFFKYCVASGI